MLSLNILYTNKFKGVIVYNINMQRTIKIKMEKNNSLIKTIKYYSKLYKYILDTGLKNKTWNKVELHKLTYKKIRKKYPTFPSALIQTVRDVASETLKRTKLKKKIRTKEYTSMRLDKRNLRVNLEHNLISMSSVKGRLKFKFKDTRMTLKYKNWKPIAGTLSYKNKQFYLNFVVEKEKPYSLQNNNILGIDRGINNILVCSNNQFFNSKHLKQVKGKYQYLKSILQSKGTRSSKRKLKNISRREKRFVKDLNHQLSKVIVNSEYDTFVLENLKKIRQNKGKRFNKKLGNWSFAQFENFLTYKSEGMGKTIIKVNPRYTSQMCSKCGTIKKSNRNGNRFKCKECGFELHADLNASRNIANLGKSEISRLSVNQPIVATEKLVTS